MFARHKVEVEFNQIYKTVGLGTTIWSPLASGVLSGKYNDKFPTDTRLGMEGLDWLKEKNITIDRIEKVQKLAELSKKIKVSLPVLSISWCLSNKNVSTVILGASKKEQLKENLKSIDYQNIITDEIYLEIENIIENKPVHPAY
jgi:aryl-alcohol dehydrogenase-like predicted oxidoreductase